MRKVPGASSKVDMAAPSNAKAVPPTGFLVMVAAVPHPGLELDGNTCSVRDVRLPSGVVGAVQGMSYQVEVLGGNSLLDPEALACIAGFAARV